MLHTFQGSYNSSRNFNPVFILSAITLLIFISIGSLSAQSKENILIKLQYLPSSKPDRIILNLAEDPLAAVGINWRTGISEKESFLEFAVATDGPEHAESPQRIKAATSYLKTQQDDEPEVEAHYHEVDLDGLSAGETYVYRVGNEGSWSEWFQFKMPENDKNVSFIYFGDAQNEVASMWSRVIRETYFQYPRVDFMLYAGDLINHEDSDYEWGEWFEAGGFIHSSTPIMMSPGNHEYAKNPVTLSHHWRPQFNLPTNGPKGLEEVAYEVNYPELKVISLDAELIDEIPEKKMLQVEWLEKILTENPKKWTVITFHYPIFSTKPDRINEDMIEFIQPILEKYKVDLVLQGHDHAYARGRVLNRDGKDVIGEGPMYVVSVAGPKMYDVGNDPWMDRKAFNTQLFQWIQIKENRLEYKAFTARGDLYDAFVLEKNKDGNNHLSNQIPNTPERLEK
jgi:hypothetical protein